MAVESLLVRDLAIVMMAAAATSIVMQRVRQPAVLGYIVAGVLVGPHVVPGGLIRDAASIAVLAELGTLFLLFSLGLDFHLGKLRRVGGLAFTAGFLQMALMVGLGVLAARLFGWGRFDALFLGAVLAISGGAVIVKVLEELGRAGSNTAEVVTGIVVVERIGGIILLALLSSYATTGALAAGPLLSLGLRLGLFILLALVAGLLVVPRLVDHVARLRVQETLVVSVLGVAFGLSILSSRLGLSIALGAFLAGALIAESRAGGIVQQRIAPLRDAFVAVFFVAMGLLLDPADLVRYAVPILAISALIIVGKTLAVGVSTLVAGYPARQSFQAGLSMGMLGGFALVIANLGRDLGVTRPSLFPVILAATAVTTLVTPTLVRRSDAIVDAAAGFLPMRIRRYTRIYVAWVGSHRPAESEVYRALHLPDLVRAGAYAVLLTLLVIGGALGARRLVGPDLTLDRVESLEMLGLLALLFLVAIPLLFGFWRSARTVLDHILLLVVPPRLRERPGGRVALLVLEATIDAFAVSAAAVVVFAAASIFVPPAPLLLGALLAVAVLAVLLRRALRRVDREMDEALDTLLEDQAAPGTREEALSLLQQRYEWDLRVESVMVPRGSALAYRRIRDLGLPSQTGASILALERAGSRIVSPSPELLIEPNDVLTLTGTLDQVEAAKRIVSEEAPPVTVTRREEGLSIEEIHLPSHSPLAGVPLAESRLREQTGATIVGLRRNGKALASPGPETLLQPSDALLVVGTPVQVTAARERIAPPR